MSGREAEEQRKSVTEMHRDGATETERVRKMWSKTGDTLRVRN